MVSDSLVLDPSSKLSHLMLVPYMSIMVRLSLVDMARAIGQLEAGVPQTHVAASFGVSQSMISKLNSKFCATGDVKTDQEVGVQRRPLHNRTGT